MSATLKELEQQARLLSPGERASLAESLLESLRPEHSAEIEAAWAKEIERRVAAHDRGEAKLIPAEEVFTKARRILAS